MSLAAIGVVEALVDLWRNLPGGPQQEHRAFGLLDERVALSYPSLPGRVSPGCKVDGAVDWSVAWQIFDRETEIRDAGAMPSNMGAVVSAEMTGIMLERLFGTMSPEFVEMLGEQLADAASEDG